MPSTNHLYNQEVIQGHREAIATLRELLATETHRAERRKLANALPPCKAGQRRLPSLVRAAGKGGRVRGARPGEGALIANARHRANEQHKHDSTSSLHNDTEDGLNNNFDHETARRIMNAPDPLSALRELQMLTHNSHASGTVAAEAPEAG